MATPARLFESWVKTWEEGWDSELAEIVHAVEARAAASIRATERRLLAELDSERQRREQERSAHARGLSELREHMEQALERESDVHGQELSALREEMAAQAKQTQGTLDALARGLREFGPSLISQHEEGIVDLRQEMLARQAAADLEVKKVAALVREDQAETAAVDAKTVEMLALAGHTVESIDTAKTEWEGVAERLAQVEVMQSHGATEMAMAALSDEVA
eukprot:COSAG06_NODE_20316_length_800_cov_0.871612_1_plen_220_part_10